MLTWKTFVVGIGLMSLVGVGAMFAIQNKGTAFKCDCSDCCDSAACSISAVGNACTLENCVGCSESTKTFEYHGASPACSACALETSAKKNLDQEIAPGDLATIEMKDTAIKHATDTTFTKLVNEIPGTVLVDFYADWCPPCKIQGRILESLAPSLSDAMIVKVNVDESPIVSRDLEIKGLPTLLVFRDGKLVASRVGLTKAEDIKSLVASE